jgi:hypothetical protein
MPPTAGEMRLSPDDRDWGIGRRGSSLTVDGLCALGRDHIYMRCKNAVPRCKPACAYLRVSMGFLALIEDDISNVSTTDIHILISFTSYRSRDTATASDSLGIR